MFLHIFEPRYREMIARCRQEGAPFGIVLIREGREVELETTDVEPYMVGTLATLREVHEYEDGRLDIHIVGGERFRIRELDRDAAPYLVGRVEAVRDEEFGDGEEMARLAEYARDRFEELIRTALEGRDFDVKLSFGDDPVALSFAIVGAIEGPERRKQALLEITDTIERFAEVVPALDERIAALQALRDEGPTISPLTPEDASGYTTPN